jgi:hypothetical protein
MNEGRTIAQRLVAGCRLPTAAVRVLSHVKSCGICGGQSGGGAGFLRVLRFPLPILIPPTAPHSSSINRGWYNRTISGRRIKLSFNGLQGISKVASRVRLATCFMLVSCLAYSSTSKMNTTCSSETSVDFQWTARRYIPEDRTHQGLLCLQADDL